MAEYFHYLFRLPFAEKPVIHMNAHQLFADGFDQQRRYHGRIHTS